VNLEHRKSKSRLWQSWALNSAWVGWGLSYDLVSVGKKAKEEKCAETEIRGAPLWMQ